MRWAMTSVSVWLSKRYPFDSSAERSSSWFSMIPLWTSAISSRDRIGCAFSVAGAPWVAQRVFASAVEPVMCSRWMRAARSATRAVLRSLPMACEPNTATPHESYPRDSRRRRPSTRTGTMSWPAAPPTMPHMASGLFLRGLPPRNGNLARPCHGELPRGRVLVDGGAGADIRAAGNANRRHERGVGADEAIVFDDGAMLVDAVVIARDRPGADV